jgi:hypothetical protein
MLLLWEQYLSYFIDIIQASREIAPLPISAVGHAIGRLKACDALKEQFLTNFLFFVILQQIATAVNCSIFKEVIPCTYLTVI